MELAALFQSKETRTASLPEPSRAIEGALRAFHESLTAPLTFSIIRSTANVPKALLPTI